MSGSKPIEVLPVKHEFWTSLVVQCIRICLSVQGTQVRSLVLEDSTCHRATKTMYHNY